MTMSAETEMAPLGSFQKLIEIIKEDDILCQKLKIPFQHSSLLEYLETTCEHYRLEPPIKTDTIDEVANRLLQQIQRKRERL